MILSFSRHGIGGGAGPVRYISSEVKWDKTTRPRAPELVEGNCNYTEKLIDSLSRKYKYTSLTINFTAGEYSKELEKKLIEEFKKAAFIGIDKDDYDCLIYRHLDTANPHLHVIIPRVHLSTGRDLNIAPPGSQATFWNAWSNATREKLGLNQIESKGLDKKPFGKNELLAINKNNNMPLLQYKVSIDKVIRQNIENGLLNNREDVIEFLKANGFTVARVTDSSISIATETKNIRLEGPIYERKTTTTGRHCLSYSEIARETTRHSRDSERSEQTTNRGFHDEFKTHLVRKYDFNQKNYKGRTESTTNRSRELLYKSPTQNKANNNLGDNVKRNSDDNRSHSASAQIKFSNDKGTRIAALTQMMNATNDPAARGQLLAQIMELTKQQTAELADVMTRGHKL